MLPRPTSCAAGSSRWAHGRMSAIVVYCVIGAGSALLWAILADLLGYPDVTELRRGSWLEWGRGHRAVRGVVGGP